MGAVNTRTLSNVTEEGWKEEGGVRRSKRKVERMVKDGYLVLRHGLSKVGMETGGNWEERKGKECEKEMEREGRAEPVGVWWLLQVLSQQRWKGRRKRTKDGERSSKGKMRVKEETKLGWRQECLFLRLERKKEGKMWNGGREKGRGRKEEEGHFLGKLSAKLERKEDDRREEGRKGESKRTSMVEKEKEGGSRLQRGMHTWGPEIWS